MDITLTKHAKQRIAQRLPKLTDLQLLLHYAEQGDHDMVITRSSIQQAEQVAIEARRRADRLRRMKGVHVPLGSDGSAITLEYLNRGKAKRVMRRLRSPE